MTARAELTVTIDGSDLEDQELNAITLQLRRQILELDVDAVSLARSSAIPLGSKPADALSLGALVVTIASTPSLMKGVIETIQVWIRDRRVRSAAVDINGDRLELTGLTRKDQSRLVEEFVSRHAK